MSDLDLIDFTKRLIAEPSITPNVCACFDLITEKLPKDFIVERLDAGGVCNLFAHANRPGPLFVFVGHVDVVPPGPESAWTFPPFTPTEHNGFLYGRGSADMKAAVACMLKALAKNFANASFNVGLLLTSDEEGIATHGIQHVMKVFAERGTKIDYALIGEPSSVKTLGDTIKVGRRGTLSGKLTIKGKQGHIAYPDLAKNPIHQFAPALTTLTQTVWDQGNAFFPATQCQFSNIHAGTGANNVIPGELMADFNFRFSSEVTPKFLQEHFEKILCDHALDYEVKWHLGGMPFLTRGGKLLNAATQTVEALAKFSPALSTNGGTSDGRFIAPTGAEVIELGLVNETIHQIDEHVKISDIHLLAEMYTRILEYLNMALR